MTLLTVLHSKKCDGNKNDKKCAKALKKYLKEKENKHHKKHHKHHKKHHDKKHHDKKDKHIIINNVISDKMKDAEKDKPTPNPAPTGQGVHQDVPYSNLMNQQRNFEKEFKKLEEEKSRFKALYNRHTGDTMNDAGTQTDHIGDIPKKSGPKKGSKNKPKTTDSGAGADMDSIDMDIERPDRQYRRDKANFGDGT